MKQISVKALAVRVLARNQHGNFNETCAKQRGNFFPENAPQKFHGFMGGNLDETTMALPSWCRTNCEHFHKLVAPEIGTIRWCCFEQDATHWRRDRIDSMSKCPMEGEL